MGVAPLDLEEVVDVALVVDEFRSERGKEALSHCPSSRPCGSGVEAHLGLAARRDIHHWRTASAVERNSDGGYWAERPQPNMKAPFRY